MGRVFANDPVELGSIPGRVIAKTLKMVLDSCLLNTQQYKEHIEGKVEQSREKSSTFPYTLVWQLLKREPSGHPQLWLPTLLLTVFNMIYQQENNIYLYTSTFTYSNQYISNIYLSLKTQKNFFRYFSYIYIYIYIYIRN